ncbi:MAG: universal stress protein [Clostridium sp.]|nr:universal stress protein [Clostridium sp.]MDY3827259.1 universal stress protein [Clostridium sp.]
MIERKPEKIKKKKVLVPIDGSGNSMNSLDFIKGIFKKEEVEITLMNVREIVFTDDIIISAEIDSAKKIADEILLSAEKELCGYDIKKYFTYGYAADEIIRKSKEDKSDFIVITKSSKSVFRRILGSVTVNVAKKAECIVMIVPE